MTLSFTPKEDKIPSGVEWVFEYTKKLQNYNNEIKSWKTTKSKIYIMYTILSSDFVEVK